MKQSFISQFLSRLTSETPIFFKKIVAIGITLAGIGGSILAVKATLASLTPPINLPSILITIAGYLVTAGTVIGIVAKAATTDPTLQAKGGSNVDVNQSKVPPVSTEASKAPVK
jgi:ABC-type xylose transport system permease subunit